MDKELKSLLEEIKAKGKFAIGSSPIDSADISHVKLLSENCLYDEDKVIFKGTCQLTEHKECNVITNKIFKGSAEMTGLDKFKLSEIPISIIR